MEWLIICIRISIRIYMYTYTDLLWIVILNQFETSHLIFHFCLSIHLPKECQPYWDDHIWHCCDHYHQSAIHQVFFHFQVQVDWCNYLNNIPWWNFRKIAISTFFFLKYLSLKNVESAKKSELTAFCTIINMFKM